MEEQGQSRWLLLMVVAAFLLGLVVLAAKDDYRFERIIESNEEYYPSVTVSPP